MTNQDQHELEQAAASIGGIADAAWIAGFNARHAPAGANDAGRWDFGDAGMFILRALAADPAVSRAVTAHLLAALPEADRRAFVAEQLDDVSLGIAMFAAWPKHIEGGDPGSGAPEVTWEIEDFVQPTWALAKAILAALRNPRQEEANRG